MRAALKAGHLESATLLYPATHEPVLMKSAEMSSWPLGVLHSHLHNTFVWLVIPACLDEGITTRGRSGGGSRESLFGSRRAAASDRCLHGTKWMRAAGRPGQSREAPEGGMRLPSPCWHLRGSDKGFVAGVVPACTPYRVHGKKAEAHLGLCVTKQLHRRGSDPTRLQAGMGLPSMLVVDRALPGPGLK
jgi:hypothetical protein